MRPCAPSPLRHCYTRSPFVRRHAFHADVPCCPPSQYLYRCTFSSFVRSQVQFSFCVLCGSQPSWSASININVHYKVFVRFAFNDWRRTQSNLLNVFHPNIPRPPTWIQSIDHLQCEYHRVSSPDCEVKAWSWKSCLLRKATRRVIRVFYYTVASFIVQHCGVTFHLFGNLFSAIFFQEQC